MFAVVIIILGLLGPPAVLVSMAKDAKSKANKERSKKLYIAAVIYLIIGLGSCGVIIASI